MKLYAGAPAAARTYVEAGRARADDYYLAEGTGIARRFAAAQGRLAELASLSGDAYEAWVAGADPETGARRGCLRTDAHAVRFVEVVVNGPKSWSLAAALHPDVAAAYDAAQERAAEQVLRWLSRHATTRVGPRGGQVQVPVDVLEAALVRHHTSRAGDPHRHLHLQVNARVFAAGQWRGLHTVGVRDCLAAINGIGQAAMACDPQFRAALAAHGYALNSEGEIRQLADFVGPFSARAGQIARNRDRYETEWASAHPGQRAGPMLRRAWDARAWADGRPDKVTPRAGAELTARWRAELAALGYRDRDRPVALAPTPIGSLDRDRVVERVLARLAAARSAWNGADIRGEAEQCLAEAGVVCDPGVRIELAEDLTARTLDSCARLLDRDGTPEHLRVWTSPAVLAVEADVTARLAARAAAPLGHREASAPVTLPTRLDAAQAAAVTALTGPHALVVLEGPAGAGKTRTLAATGLVLATQGRRLVVVTPTLKAAKVAHAEVGAPAGSAACLAYEYGWRWTSDGGWARLAVGDVDPMTGWCYPGPHEGTQLDAGDLLVVDEAGMLDQDTARALLTIADDSGVHVALLGDRHQLPAVGRGGVLDLAVAEVDAAAHVTLTGVHRFTRVDAAGRTRPDTEYADLTLAMRTGEHPGRVFDALMLRQQIRLHENSSALREALAAAAADAYASGEGVAVVADTREQADQLNAATRDRLVAVGRVDDTAVAVTGAGQRIGVGDRIATRRNDRTLGVANRDTWVVTALDAGGGLHVTPAADGAERTVTPGGRDRRWLPAGYVTAHVELAYATTAHGVQGDTVTTSHVVIGEHTGAAAAYVGMTRGRCSNTAHLVAADVGGAREQWLAVFARDRADLGPAHAARLAAVEAAKYAVGRPLEQVLAELRTAWTAEHRCLTRLDELQREREVLAEAVRDQAAEDARRTDLRDRCAATEAAKRRAGERAAASGAALAADADRRQRALLAAWDRDRPTASAAAQAALAGPGRLRLRRAAVARAEERLTTWADRWRTWLPALPTNPTTLASIAAAADDRPTLTTALSAAASRAAQTDHPEHAGLAAAARSAAREHEDAQRALARAGRLLSPSGTDRSYSDELARRTANIVSRLATAREELTDLRSCLATLAAEPALRAQPGDRLEAERAAWTADRATAEAAQRWAFRPTACTPLPKPPQAGVSMARGRDAGRSVGR